MAGETPDDPNVNENSEKELKKDDNDPTETNGVTSDKLVKLPISRIRKIIKLDPDVSLASQEAMVALTKATVSYETKCLLFMFIRLADVFLLRGMRRVS